MSLNPITCTVNGGAEVTLKSLGLKCTGIDFHNMQADVASLVWTRENSTIECPLAYNDVVELFMTERRIFQGRARIGSIGHEGGPIELLGPWSHLDEQHWQVSLLGGPAGPKLGDTYTEVYGEGQEYWDGESWVPGPITITWTVGTETIYDPENPTVGTIDICLGWTARYYLYAPLGGFLPFRTVLSQWENLFAMFAHTRSPNEPFVVGGVELGATQRPKFRTVQDLMLADAVRQALTSKPDAACWFDYDVEGVPELFVRVASLETSMPLALPPTAGSVVVDRRLKVMDHLIPAGVVIRYEREVNPSTGLGKPWFIDRWPADVVPYEPQVLVQTVTETEVNNSTGIAHEIYDSLAVRRTQGQIQIRDNDFSLGLRPGMVIELTGDPEVAGVQNWVQSVRWNPADGMANLTVGYPQHLSLQARQDLRHWLRNCFYVPRSTATQANT